MCRFIFGTKQKLLKILNNFEVNARVNIDPSLIESITLKSTQTRPYLSMEQLFSM